MCTGHWWGNLNERDHLANMSVHGRKWVLRSIGGHWTSSSDRIKCRAVVDMVMKFGFRKVLEFVNCCLLKEFASCS